MPNHLWVTSGCGLTLPGLIYGTAWKKERTAELVIQAVTAGFRGIDTACQPKHYDEALVGSALQHLAKQGIGRDALYVQTKFTPLAGHDPQRIPYPPQASIETQVARSFQVSQANLRTDYVDCLLLHSPLTPFSLSLQAWQAMEQIYHAGGARWLGVSNCYDLAWLQALYAKVSVKPVVVQNRFYHETGYDVALRAWLAEHGMVYQSFWTLTANPFILQHPALQQLAQQYHVTAAQLFFRAVTQIGIVPLTGTTSLRHLTEDLAIFSFTLSEVEIQRIQALLSDA